MVEGTILQNKLELGMGQVMGAGAFIGADDDYSELIAQRATRLTTVHMGQGGQKQELSKPYTDQRGTLVSNSEKKIWQIISVENVPEMLPSNLRKLKAAYRHPFEYINPRLYQKRVSIKEVVDEDKFFVENEEEF